MRTNDTKYSFRNALRALLEVGILRPHWRAHMRWHDDLMVQYTQASEGKRRWLQHDRRWVKR